MNTTTLDKYATEGCRLSISLTGRQRFLLMAIIEDYKERNIHMSQSKLISHLLDQSPLMAEYKEVFYG